MNHPLVAPLTHEQPARFTADEFLALARDSAFDDIAGKIELVDGVITRMSPPHYPHSNAQYEVFIRLLECLADNSNGLLARFEIGVRLADDTVRIPDIAVFRDPGAITGVLDGEQLLLVIEIADSSLATDIGPKARSYAAAGVPHYWVVDIVNARVHRMGLPLDGDYARRDVSAFGEPLAIPDTDRAVTIG